MALLDHQLHVPQPANPAAGLSELHIMWRILTQHVHKSVRQPLQFGTRSDVANNRVIIMRWVKGRSLVLYTCLVADTEVPSMTLKNSKASNSYSGEAERRWLLPPISDKQQKRPISTRIIHRLIIHLTQFIKHAMYSTIQRTTTINRLLFRRFPTCVSENKHMI